MRKLYIAVHGGAGPDSKHIKENIKGYESGLKNAIERGYSILLKGGQAVDAVEEAIRQMEDDPLFNAGKGSALNSKGEVQMDASVMNGQNLRTGAVASLSRVKNPVSLARYIMEHREDVLFAGSPAVDLATKVGFRMESPSFFVTPYQYDQYREEREKALTHDMVHKTMHGTVGAVALDKNGDLAAATSTGGQNNALPGSVSDSCLIGAGCYANNRTCAVSVTGDRQFIVSGMIAHSISCVMEFTGCGIQQACDHVVQVRNRAVKGDIGVIGLDAKGNIGISFNSKRMHRGWIGDDRAFTVQVYR
jgi:beta-aspartyl-peptidase (threonine type)